MTVAFGSPREFPKSDARLPTHLPDAKAGFTEAEAHQRANQSGNRDEVLIPEQDLLQGWAGLVQYQCENPQTRRVRLADMAFLSPFLTNPSENRGTISGVSSACCPGRSLQFAWSC